jgi:hypothetical protein
LTAINSSIGAFGKMSNRDHRWREHDGWGVADRITF